MLLADAQCCVAGWKVKKSKSRSHGNDFSPAHVLASPVPTMEKESKTVQKWRREADYSKNEIAALRMCKLQISPFPSQIPLSHVAFEGKPPSINTPTYPHKQTLTTPTSNSTPVSFTSLLSTPPHTPTTNASHHSSCYQPLSPCSTFPLSPSRASDNNNNNNNNNTA